MKPLLFIHIPKTGGMAIRSVLKDSLFDLDYGNRHLSAVEYYLKFGKQLYNKLYKFAVVRNPYDRIVSYYYFMLKDQDHTNHIVHTQSLSEYVAWACSGEVSTQFEHIAINGRIAVDRVLSFELLQADWELLAYEFGLQSQLPILNQSVHKFWADVLTVEDRALIYKSFEVDFKMFEYPE